MESLIDSSLLSQCGKYLAKEGVAKVLKLIPGCGSVVGGIINAIVASIFTSALGYLISELCFKYANSLKYNENIDIFTSELILELINFYLKNSQKKDNNEVEINE